MTPDDLLCNEVHGRVEDAVRQVRHDLNDYAEDDAATLWDAMAHGLSDDHAEDLAFELMKENYRDNDD